MHRIDVHKLADEAKFNRFHAVVLLWCVLIIVIDGYDLAVAGIALPSIMKDMNVDASTAGFMASSALFGMMFGAIFLGALCRQDRSPLDDLDLRCAVQRLHRGGRVHQRSDHVQRHALPRRPRHRRRDAQHRRADDRILAARRSAAGW